MTVAIAHRVFGSSVRVGLIRHYSQVNGGSQADAARVLDLSQQVVSRNTAALIEAGAIIEGRYIGRGQRPGEYFVDEDRVQELALALLGYSLPKRRFTGLDDAVRRAVEQLHR